jgi:hypothetical protein
MCNCCCPAVVALAAAGRLDPRGGNRYRCARSDGTHRRHQDIKFGFQVLNLIAICNNSMIISTARFPIVVIDSDRLTFLIASKISGIICWHNGSLQVIVAEILAFMTPICSCIVARRRNPTRSISSKC